MKFRDLVRVQLVNKKWFLKGIGTGIMFTYKMNVDVKEWDLFLENHPQGNLLQSSDWSKIKDTWGNERVGFYKDNQLVGVANILIQPLPLGLSMFYIPRGPVIDYEDKELLKFNVEKTC